MTLTDIATRELAAQDCATPWLVLLEISHPQLPAPLRLTSDGVATLSNGASYEPFPFEVTLPDERSASTTSPPRSSPTSPSTGDSRRCGRERCQMAAVPPLDPGRQGEKA